MRLSDALRHTAAALRRTAGRLARTLGRVAQATVRVVRSVRVAVQATATVVKRTVKRAPRWSRVAVPLFAAACSRADAPTPTVNGDISERTRVTSIDREARHASTDASPDASVDAPIERSLGNFQLTFYYVADEAEVAASTRTTRAGKRSAPTATKAADHAAPRAASQAAPSSSASKTASTAAKAATTPATATAAATATTDLDDPADDGDEPGRDAGGHEEATFASGMPDLVPVYDRTCKTLGNVSRAFAAQLAMQGTGRLRDGRVLNVAGPCTCARTPCFHVLPSHRKWGMGGSGQPLEPFRTVAVDPRKVKLGSLLYVPALDGVRMPGPRGVGGFIHDGCVVAGDTGGGVQGAQLDLFVARRAYYRGLARRGGSHGWARSVEVLDGTTRCQRRGGQVSRAGAI